MELLRKRGLKIDDESANQVACTFDRLARGLPPSGVPTLEGYLEGQVVVDVGIKAMDRQRTHDLHPRQLDLRLELKYPPRSNFLRPELDAIRRIGWFDDYLRFIASRKDGNEGNMTMLVDVPQFLKYRKILPLGSVLPCNKGLYLLNGGQETPRQAP
jgi:hypothetical protein